MPRLCVSIRSWTETGAPHDLVTAAQNPTEQQYDWDRDKTLYIALLRAFDGHRDVTDLAEFIGVEQIEK